MPRSIQVETGEDQFSISVEQIPGDVRFVFTGTEAILPSAEWNSIVRQVKTRSLSKWKHTRTTGPMSETSFRRLLSGVNSSSQYQLFLAGFDIAVVVRLVTDPEDQVVFGNCTALAGKVGSAIGPRKLVFVSDTLVREGGDPLNQLMASKRVCRLIANIGTFPGITKYYISYIPASGILADLSPEANELWDRISKYYYAFR